MQDLYQDAILRYGWPSIPLHNPSGHPDGLNTSANPIGGAPWGSTNRKYFLWYARIAQRSGASIMKQTAYDVIATHNWAGNPPKVSNYEDTNADGAPETYGWFPRQKEPRIINPPTSDHSYFEPSTGAVRGIVSIFSGGYEFFTRDLVEPNDHYSVWWYEP
jgi:hypothetical protein